MLYITDALALRLARALTPSMSSLSLFLFLYVFTERWDNRSRLHLHHHDDHGHERPCRLSLVRSRSAGAPSRSGCHELREARVSAISLGLMAVAL